MPNRASIYVARRPHLDATAWLLLRIHDVETRPKLIQVRMRQETIVLKAPDDDAWVDFNFPGESLDLGGEEHTMRGNERLVRRLRNERVAGEDVRFALAVAFLAGRGVHKHALVLVQ